MEVEEVSDERSLELYFKQNRIDRRSCTWIATRAAIRVFPIAQALWSGTVGFNQLWHWRLILAAGMFAENPTPSSKAACVAALRRSSSIGTTSHSGEAAKGSAEAAALSSDDKVVASEQSANAVAFSAEAVGQLESRIGLSVWKQIRSDLRELADTSAYGRPIPLWLATEPSIVDLDMKFRLPLRSDPGWTFWADWYERYVKGDPQPWDLLEKIALQGTEDDDYSFWEGTDAEVNARIMEIVAAHEVDKLIAENPYALKIIVDRKTEKLASTPSETVSLADIIKAIRRALRDYKRRCEKDDSANKLGEQILSILGSVVEDLERDIRRFKGDPLNLHEGIKAAAKELHKTAAREGLTNEGAVERLCDSLETALTDIAVASPDVLETLKARNKVQVQLFSDEQVKLATRLISGMEQDSEGLLKAAAHLALQVISDESKDIEEKQAAWYFVRAVVPRGAKAMKEHIEEKAKAKSLGDRAGEVADAVIKGDKVIGAGQEAVQEAGPWLTEAWTQIASGSFFGF